MPSSTALQADPSFVDGICASMSAASGAQTFERVMTSICDPLIERSLIIGARLDFASQGRDPIVTGGGGPDEFGRCIRIPLPPSTMVKVRLSIYAECQVSDGL